MVDARALHEALKSGAKFADWIKFRLAEFAFIEGEDFFRNPGRNHGNAVDYLLTLDTAKELAMVERSETGWAIRRYFIECEKRLHAGPVTQTPVNTSALGKLQQINAGLIEVVGEHAGRIEHLEASITPGPDWMTLLTYCERHGLLVNGGWLSVLTVRCLNASARRRVPTGEVRARGGKWAKTYSPEILDAEVPHRIARWVAKRAAKEVAHV